MRRLENLRPSLVVRSAHLVKRVAADGAIAWVLGASVLCCSSESVVIDGSSGAPSPRSFPVCDATSDFGGAKEMPGTDLVASAGLDADYWIDASLSDDESHVYFSACSTSRGRKCYLVHGVLDQDGAVSHVETTATGTRSAKHPTIAPDRSTLVWLEDVGRTNLVYLASRDPNSYQEAFQGRREVLVLPREENLRYSDPYIGRDGRLYLMLGPSSGTSTVHSIPLTALRDAANTTVVDAALTGTNPVIDGGGTVFLGQYDANTGLRSIVTTSRDGRGTYGTPSGRYVAGLHPENTSNYPTWISKDGCRLYFTRGKKDDITSYRIWMASRKTKP